MTIVFDTMETPVGELLLTAEATGLTSIYFDTPDHSDLIDPAWQRADGRAGDASRIVAVARAQLEAYFAGALTTFDVPLAPRGTLFQQRVWTALRGLTFGETISYAELARRIGNPRAVRAVGGANARNPLPVIVPCHRVIGADGSLTGFGGGIARKRWLLEHETMLLHETARSER